MKTQVNLPGDGEPFKRSEVRIVTGGSAVSVTKTESGKTESGKTESTVAPPTAPPDPDPEPRPDPMSDPLKKPSVVTPGFSQSSKEAAKATRMNLSKRGFADRKEIRDTNKRACPFQIAATNGHQRLKILLWGETGTLKTRTALQFPSPAVIDLERGTERYRGEFNFHVLPPSAPEEIYRSIIWLRDNPHEFRTIIIDPITVYWSSLQRKWSDIFLERLVGRKGHQHEFFELGPREWSTIKAEFNELLRTCLQLDMNVVFVAHDKAAYESTSGDFMRRIGEAPDSEKNMERVFDIILRCERLVGKDGQEFYATVRKDRTNKLPQRFRLDQGGYAQIATAAGLDSINRKAEPRQAPTPEQLKEISDFVAALQLSAARIYDRLQAYGVSRFEDLSRVQAQAVLEKLQEAVTKREEAQRQSVKNEEPIGGIQGQTKESA